MAQMFSFDPSKGETQESLRRRREVAQAMLEASNRPAQTLGEGLASFGDSVFGTLREKDAARSEHNSRQMVADALLKAQQGGGITLENSAQMMPYADEGQRFMIAQTLAQQDEARRRAQENEDWTNRLKAQEDSANARLDKQLAAQRQIAAMSAANRTPEAPVAVMTPDGPRYVSRQQALGMQPYSMRQGAGSLPVAMQKAEDSDLEAVDLARNIASDINAQRSALQDGAFKVDPASKASYWLGGAVGMGGPETAAYNSFRATLEKMRNDSLRLNKGVQTEGDAVRAWNEVFTAMGSNDMGTVSNRLQEIEQINQRAAAEAQRRIDVRRQRNGTDPFDWQSYTSMGSPLAGGQVSIPTPVENAAQPAPAAAVPAGAPAPGTMQDGYRFKGGDPANPTNWEKVQ